MFVNKGDPSCMKSQRVKKGGGFVGQQARATEILKDREEVNLSRQVGIGGGKSRVQEMKEQAAKSMVQHCLETVALRKRQEAELEMADKEDSLLEADIDGQD